jgi:hypothetical protein
MLGGYKQLDVWIGCGIGGMFTALWCRNLLGNDHKENLKGD